MNKTLEYGHFAILNELINLCFEQQILTHTQKGHLDAMNCFVEKVLYIVLTKQPNLILLSFLIKWNKSHQIQRVQEHAELLKEWALAQW
jgi:hypothetical protein